MLLFVKTFSQAMSAYGYEIVQTLIVDIEPDEHVKRAMNEINAGIVHQLMSYLLSFCISYFISDAKYHTIYISHD